MVGFEDLERLEESNELLHRNLEGLDPAKVSGFEQLSDTANMELVEYLNEVIPPKHFDSCPGIEYDPDNEYFGMRRRTLGMYNIETHEITIAGQERFRDTNDMLDTVVHEVGHNAYDYIERTQPQSIKVWESIHNNSFKIEESSGYGFVSEYAKQSKFEDFAESYCAYIRDPELLKFMNEQKYEFMKYNIFEGRDYLQDTLSLSLEIPSSHLDGLFELNADAQSNRLIIEIPKTELVHHVGANLYQEYISQTPGLLNDFTQIAGSANEGLFIEAYSNYILHPESLRNNNSALYDFMCDDVFWGKEYTVSKENAIEYAEKRDTNKEENEYTEGCKGVTLDLIARTKDSQDGRLFAFGCHGETYDVYENSKDAAEESIEVVKVEQEGEKMQGTKLCESLDYYAPYRIDTEGILFSSNMGYKKPNTCGFEVYDRIEMRCD